MELNFEYSPKLETERILYTIKKYPWFKENNYRVNFPASLIPRIEKGESIASEEIHKAVEDIFDTKDYENAKNNILSDWDNISEEFEKGLITLGGHVFDSYDIFLTKYGVGGSYGIPNNVQVNIDYGRTPTATTITHEIIHLAIEHWVQEHKISHWVKERLVDLTLAKILPDRARIQREEIKYTEIKEIFENNFPAMENIIKKVSETL